MASVRGDTARLRERVDALAHGADAGLRAVDGKVDRVKSSVRGAKVRSCLLACSQPSLANCTEQRHANQWSPDQTRRALFGRWTKLFIRLYRTETCAIWSPDQTEMCTIWSPDQTNYSRRLHLYAQAAARMAEARCVALAGEVGRVARHAGLEGVGDALRTAVLFEPPPVKTPATSSEQRDGYEGGILSEYEARTEADAAEVAEAAMAPASPPQVSRGVGATMPRVSQGGSRGGRRVTWEVDGELR